MCITQLNTATHHSDLRHYIQYVYYTAEHCKALYTVCVLLSLTLQHSTVILGIIYSMCITQLNTATHHSDLRHYIQYVYYTAEHCKALYTVCVLLSLTLQHSTVILGIIYSMCITQLNTATHHSDLRHYIQYVYYSAEHCNTAQ